MRLLLICYESVLILGVVQAFIAIISMSFIVLRITQDLKSAILLLGLTLTIYIPFTPFLLSVISSLAC